MSADKILEKNRKIQALDFERNLDGAFTGAAGIVTAIFPVASAIHTFGENLHDVVEKSMELITPDAMWQASAFGSYGLILGATCVLGAFGYSAGQYVTDQKYNRKRMYLDIAYLGSSAP